MVEFADEAIVLTALPHGEHGAVVRFLSFTGGLRAGFLHGARSSKKRALIVPGNRVALRLTARTEGQLPVATVELVESRALIAFSPHGAAISGWLAELTAASLAEGVPHARLAAALDALLAGMAADAPAVAARAGLARYELLLLEEEGLGLDLAVCALGGAGAPAFVSPKTGRAVSAEMASGQSWAHLLLPLPPFLLRGGEASATEAADALRLTGHFLGRHWLHNDRMKALRRLAVGGAGG